MKQTNQDADDELFCDVCGMTYKEFLETGVFGCENCYKVFKARTVKLIKDKVKEDFISHQKAILTTKTKETKVSKPKNLKERIKELENLLELCKKYNEVEKVRVIEKELEELRKIEKEK